MRSEITLFYRSGWHPPVLHYSIDGSRWIRKEFTISNDDHFPMQSMWWNLTIPTSSLQFVCCKSDAGSGATDWDNHPSGGNYIINTPGVYVLDNGNLRPTGHAAGNISDEEFEELFLKRLHDRHTQSRVDSELKERIQRDAAILASDLGDLAHAVQAKGIYHEIFLSYTARQLVPQIIRDCGGHLIKAQDSKFFSSFPTCRAALNAAVWINLTMGELNFGKPLEDHILLRHGIAFGSILFVPDDVYGDAVSIATRLAEDLALPSEILILQASLDPMKDTLPEALRNLIFHRAQTVIGELPVKFWRVDYSHPSLHAAFPIAVLQPDNQIVCAQLERLCTELKGTRGVATPAVRNAFEENKTVVVTDLEGFTRVTTHKGYIHFLSLIVKMRSACLGLYESLGGHLVNKSGKKLVFMFDTPGVAIRAITQAMLRLREYNRDQDSDDKVYICVGMDHGVIVNAGDDVYGLAHDVARHLGELLAGPEQILVTEAAYKLASEDTALSTYMMEFQKEAGKLIWSSRQEDSDGAVAYYCLDFE